MKKGTVIAIAIVAVVAICGVENVDPEAECPRDDPAVRKS